MSLCYLSYLTFSRTCRKSFRTKCKCLLFVWWIIQIIPAFTQGLKSEEIMKWKAQRVEERKANWTAEEEHKICRQCWWENEFPSIFQHGKVQYIMIRTSWPLMQCICFVSQTWPVKSYLAIMTCSLYFPTCQSTAHQLFDIKYWFKMAIHQKPESMYYMYILAELLQFTYLSFVHTLVVMYIKKYWLLLVLT